MEHDEEASNPLLDNVEPFRIKIIEDDATTLHENYSSTPNSPAVRFLLRHASVAAAETNQTEVEVEGLPRALTDAITETLEQTLPTSFDVTANFWTLIAVIGVVLFWRGLWNMWDCIFGTEIWSNLSSLLVGLVIMIGVRFGKVPLVNSLPGG